VPPPVILNIERAYQDFCKSAKDDHYPVCRLDIRQDGDFATGSEYPKTAFKREPDTDKDIRNAFIDILRIQTFLKKVAHCAIIHVSSEFLLQKHYLQKHLFSCMELCFLELSLCKFGTNSAAMIVSLFLPANNLFHAVR